MRRGISLVRNPPDDLTTTRVGPSDRRVSVFLPRPLIVGRVATRAVLDRKPNLLVLWGFDQSRVSGCLVIICEDGPGWQRPNIPVTDNSLTTPLPSFTCCESNEIRPLAYNRHKSCHSYSPNLRLDRWISANRRRDFRVKGLHFPPALESNDLAAVSRNRCT